MKFISSKNIHPQRKQSRKGAEDSILDKTAWYKMQLFQHWTPPRHPQETIIKIKSEKLYKKEAASRFFKEKEQNGTLTNRQKNVVKNIARYVKILTHILRILENI